MPNTTLDTTLSSGASLYSINTARSSKSGLRAGTSRSQSPTPRRRSRSASIIYNTVSRGQDLAHILEAQFEYRYFDTDEAEANIAPMVNLKKLNLANNVLDRVPILPTSLTCLNLNNNPEIEGLHTFASRPALSSTLKELQLQKTGVTTTRIFNSLVALVSLNLADNLITRVDGLEALSVLRLLDLSNNQIKTVLSLRSLGCNKALEILDLRGNPVCEQGTTYRVSVIGFCPNLIEFDNKTIKTAKSHAASSTPSKSRSASAFSSSSSSSSSAFSLISKSS